MQAKRSVLALCLIAAIAHGSEADWPSGPIESARVAHQLESHVAQQGLAVRLEGVVTHFNRRIGDGFFLQDETDGIYVRLLGANPDFEAGDRVRIEGRTEAGDFAPVVVLNAWENLGAQGFPEPKRVSASALATGRYDSQWVEVRGVIRSATQAVRNQTPHLALELRADGRDLLVGVSAFSSASLDLADAEVVVRGVAAGIFSHRRQLLAPVVVVESDADIRVVDPPRPFDQLPVRRIETLFRYASEGFPDRRVRLRGQLLGQRSGRWMAVRDESSGLFVEMTEASGFSPGDNVELVGFPTMRDQTLWLVHAEVQRIAPGSLGPVAQSSIPEARGNPCELRTIEGTLTGPPRPGEGGWVLDLVEGEHQFEAWVPSAGGAYPTAWRRGARFSITGITEPFFLPSHRLEMFPFPLGLRVHARDSDDVKILVSAPWSTSPDLARIVLFVLVGVLAMLGSVSVAALVLARKNADLRTARKELRMAQEELARRFTVRTGEWQEELAARHAAEADFALLTAERTRLARELHDTLEQSLASVALQLDAAKGFFREYPNESERLLETATVQLRDSQAEVRRSVWNLRAVKLEDATLPEALAQLGKALRDTQGPSVDVRCSGDPVELPPWVASHLFRVAQEAVTNALKHARARTIRVELAFSGEGVSLMVDDDGTGFDVRAGAADGHFGLRGLRERAAALGARLDLRSTLGEGTWVHVHVPASRLSPNS